VPRALLRYPLRTDEALARVDAPVWLIHGDADDVVPFAHSERLHARFPRTRLYRVAGGGHNDLPAFPAFHDALRAALAAR
jgi:pimeloyl-ACP methyl ester carboxylesterase